MGIILVLPGGGGHGHSHGTAKPHSSKSRENINIRAAFIHILGDTLCTLGLLIAAIIIKFRVSRHILLIISDDLLGESTKIQATQK